MVCKKCKNLINNRVKAKVKMKWLVCLYIVGLFNIIVLGIIEKSNNNIIIGGLVVLLTTIMIFLEYNILSCNKCDWYQSKWLYNKKI